MVIVKVAEAFLPTKYGKFRVHAFKEADGKEHIALVRMQRGSADEPRRICPHGKHRIVPVRIHSKCLTGDTLTSRRCDCRDQLEAALRYLERRKCGIFIYLDQEGRGIGLSNKIKAYALQDQGMDTVEANVHLGFGEDIRDYSVAAAILRYFRIEKIALLTNNPRKIADLKRHGINVVKRIPLITKPNRYNREYLGTKRKKMRHLL